MDEILWSLGWTAEDDAMLDLKCFTFVMTTQRNKQQRYTIFAHSDVESTCNTRVAMEKLYVWERGEVAQFKFRNMPCVSVDHDADEYNDDVLLNTADQDDLFGELAPNDLFDFDTIGFESVLDCDESRERFNMHGDSQDQFDGRVFETADKQQ